MCLPNRIYKIVGYDTETFLLFVYCCKSQDAFVKKYKKYSKREDKMIV